MTYSLQVLEKRQFAVSYGNKAMKLMLVYEKSIIFNK